MVNYIQNCVVLYKRGEKFLNKNKIMEKVKRTGIWASIMEFIKSFRDEKENIEQRENLEDISENYCRNVNVSKAERNTLIESLAKLSKKERKEGKNENDELVEKYGPVEESAIRKVAERMNNLEKTRQNNGNTEISNSDNSHDYR